MDDSLRTPVDIEHAGIRAVVLVAFVAASLLVCGAVTLALPDLGVVIAGAVALLVGIGASALVERRLKGRWLSGRELVMDGGGIRLLRKGDVEASIDAGADPEVMRWHFQARKQRRIPKGWHVVALALTSDDQALALYTLMSSERFEALPQHQRFKTLMPPSKTGSASEDMRLAGEQRRLHEAEAIRWNAGAELNNDAFEDAVKRIETMFG